MVPTSETAVLTSFDIAYFRQQLRNRVFEAVIAYFADRAAAFGLTKAAIAAKLGKEPSQITRWLAGPGNWTLDTISDLLLAMDAELEPVVMPLNEEYRATPLTRTNADMPLRRADASTTAAKSSEKFQILATGT
jgi:DNA-binding phage protein